MSSKILCPDTEIKNSFRVRSLRNVEYSNSSLISVTYNRIFLIEDGEGSIIVDDCIFDLGTKEIFLVSKGQMLSFSQGTSFSGYEILFGDCFWEKAPASASNCKQLLFNNAVLHQKMTVSENDFSAVEVIVEMMYTEYTTDDYPNKLDAMAAYLKIIMIKLANSAPLLQQGVDDFDNKTYRKFLELVSIKYLKMHDVQYYADSLSVTPRKISEISKKKCGKGAKEIIAGQIIAESKRQLQFSAKTIKDIAYELSFSTPEQFSHFFKKYTGVSPLDYRKVFVNIGR